MSDISDEWEHLEIMDNIYKEIDLNKWKWLRKIDGNDRESFNHYLSLANKNEAMIVEINGEYAYNVYTPENTSRLHNKKPELHNNSGGKGEKVT
jgi:transketolase